MARGLLKSILVVYFLTVARLTVEWDTSTYSTPYDGEIAGYVNGVAYTYMKPYIGLPKRRLDQLYINMTLSLGQNKTELMTKLQSEFDEDPAFDANTCYLQVYGVFMEHCYPSYIYGGLRRFKQMLAQACTMESLNVSTISGHLVRLCKQFSDFKYTIDLR